MRTMIVIYAFGIIAVMSISFKKKGTQLIPDELDNYSCPPTDILSAQFFNPVTLSELICNIIRMNDMNHRADLMVYQ